MTIADEGDQSAQKEDARSHKVEVAPKTAQNEPDVVAGERTPIGSTKDSFFNTET